MDNVSGENHNHAMFDDLCRKVDELEAYNEKLRRALMAFVPASERENFWKLMKGVDAKHNSDGDS